MDFFGNLISQNHTLYIQVCVLSTFTFKPCQGKGGPYCLNLSDIDFDMNIN